MHEVGIISSMLKKIEKAVHKVEPDVEMREV